MALDQLMRLAQQQQQTDPFRQVVGTVLQTMQQRQAQLDAERERQRMDKQRADDLAIQEAQALRGYMGQTTQQLQNLIAQTDDPQMAARLQAAVDAFAPFSTSTIGSAGDANKFLKTVNEQLAQRFGAQPGIPSQDTTLPGGRTQPGPQPQIPGVDVGPAPQGVPIPQARAQVQGRAADPGMSVNQLIGAAQQGIRVGEETETSAAQAAANLAQELAAIRDTSDPNVTGRRSRAAAIGAREVSPAVRAELEAQGYSFLLPVLDDPMSFATLTDEEVAREREANIARYEAIPTQVAIDLEKSRNALTVQEQTIQQNAQALRMGDIELSTAWEEAEERLEAIKRNNQLGEFEYNRAVFNEFNNTGFVQEGDRERLQEFLGPDVDIDARQQEIRSRIEREQEINAQLRENGLEMSNDEVVISDVNRQIAEANASNRAVDEQIDAGTTLSSLANDPVMGLSTLREIRQAKLASSYGPTVSPWSNLLDKVSLEQIDAAIQGAQDMKELQTLTREQAVAQVNRQLQTWETEAELMEILGNPAVTGPLLQSFQGKPEEFREFYDDNPRLQAALGTAGYMYVTSMLDMQAGDEEEMQAVNELSAMQQLLVPPDEREGMVNQVDGVLDRAQITDPEQRQLWKDILRIGWDAAYLERQALNASRTRAGGGGGDGGLDPSDWSRLQQDWIDSFDRTTEMMESEGCIVEVSEREEASRSSSQVEGYATGPNAGSRNCRIFSAQRAQALEMVQTIPRLMTGAVVGPAVDGGLTVEDPGEAYLNPRDWMDQFGGPGSTLEGLTPEQIAGEYTRFLEDPFSYQAPAPQTTVEPLPLTSAGGGQGAPTTIGGSLMGTLGRIYEDVVGAGGSALGAGGQAVQNLFGGGGE